MIESLAQFGTLDARSRLLLILVVASVVIAALAISFVVAAVLLRWRNVRKARRWNALEARWESLLLDHLSTDAPASALLAQVDAGNELYFVDFLSRFASRVRGTERVRIGEVAKPFLPRVERQLRSRFPGVRGRAVRTLSLLGLHDYSYGIIAALDDPSPFVAMTAARALSRREQPRFAPAVLTRLHRFGDWSPAFLSAMLAGIGPEAAPYLRGTLGDDAQPAAIRVVAADALRALHDLESADIAAEVARTSTDRNLTAACLRLVRACGRAAHADVVRMLAVSPDETVRAQALGALSTLGDAKDIELIRGALDDPSVWVVWHSARALLAIGGRAAVESLVAAGHRRGDVLREVLTEAA